MLSKTKADEWFFLPDPTESTSSIGGIVSCDSSGAKSFLYGSTRNYVDGLRVVLADGDIIDLKRNECFAINNKFSLTTISGGKNFIFPSYIFI